MKTLFYLIVTLFAVGCIPIDWVEPIPPPFGNPSDTINDDTIAIEPIQVIDCDSLVHITDPAYTVITLWFINGMPIAPKWRWNQTSIMADSMHHLLKEVYPQYEYKYFEGNGSITVIVEGVTNNDLFQGKILSEDAFGQIALATAFGRSLFHYGSMTAEEGVQEAINRPSLTGIHFTNVNWTVEEKNKFSRIALHADKMKHGENHAVFTGSGVQMSIVDTFNMYCWAHVHPFVSWEINKS